VIREKYSFLKMFQGVEVIGSMDKLQSHQVNSAIIWDERAAYIEHSQKRGPKHGITDAREIGALEDKQEA
jgi:hypothetical protein